jgi:hypothetical protein
MQERFFEETGAYKIKNRDDVGKIRQILSTVDKKWSKVWTDDTIMGFAKGSYVGDCARKAKILTKYYRPLVTKYVGISLSESLQLEKSIAFLSSPNSPIHDKKYEIKFFDQEGKVHPKSRELYFAVEQIRKSHERLNEVINSLS